MKNYRVFTVSAGEVKEGAEVVEFNLKGAGVSIPAIVIGETGRNRSQGVLPVVGASAGSIVKYASVAQTRAGKPKLVARSFFDTDDACIVVFRTPIGFRGSNGHFEEKGEGEKLVVFNNPLSEGYIAQGDAGRMGMGKHYVVVLPIKKVVFVVLGGRLYGAPSRHYYMYDGERLLTATQEEREVSEVF